jgi:hypothetical protein
MKNSEKKLYKYLDRNWLSNDHKIYNYFQLFENANLSEIISNF